MVLPAIPPGQLGEFYNSTVAVGSAVSLSTATAKDITSLLLQPGEWLVYGTVVFVGSSWTTVPQTPMTAGISQTTNTLPATGDLQATLPQTITTTSSTHSVAVPPQILRLSAATTIYLEAQATFSAGTCTAYGRLEARRMR